MIHRCHSSRANDDDKSILQIRNGPDFVEHAVWSWDMDADIQGLPLPVAVLYADISGSSLSNVFQQAPQVGIMRNVTVVHWYFAMQNIRRQLKFAMLFW